MALSLDDTKTVASLAQQIELTGFVDQRLDSYYEGQQRLQHIGLAVPPELRRFETVVNWPRLCVDSLAERMSVKSLMLPGVDVADPSLQEAWDYNNLDSESNLAHLDAFVYGRAFVCVGYNEEDPEHPLITVESPREVIASFDPRTRRVKDALRLYGYGDGDPNPTLATLYQPNSTTWLEKGTDGRWRDYERDDHNVGRVPVYPLLNRRRTGRYAGVSEMADVIPLTDAAARTLTNLQIAGETHSVPQKYVLGMSKGDFVNADGSPIPAWESYFSAIMANANPSVKVGQFTASDLKNFHDTVNHYASLVAGTSGLPMRYLGQVSTNPPSADGIRADESRLVKRAELRMSNFGNVWGQVLAHYLRIRDGEWVDGNRITVEWHDAGTPTYGAKVDGVQKLTGGKPILSTQGGWDELGWSEARKQREMAYLQAEQTDPTLEAIARDLTGGASAPASGQ